MIAAMAVATAAALTPSTMIQVYGTAVKGTSTLPRSGQRFAPATEVNDAYRLFFAAVNRSLIDSTDDAIRKLRARPDAAKFADVIRQLKQSRDQLERETRMYEALFGATKNAL